MILPLNGWAAGKFEKSFEACDEFFQAFENEEITGACVNVKCTASKKGQDVLIDLSMEGKVSVRCDRCLEKLDLPVSETAALVARTRESGEESASGREVILYEVSDKEIDLSQVVYDYICLSLPMQKVHPEGQCNPEVVKYLGQAPEAPAPEEGENPFSVLKGLFKEK